MSKRAKFDLKKIKFDRHGLVPAIIQDCKNSDILMLAYMNKESLHRTIKSGRTCFWSRSRRKYWIKGETSGNFQFVKSIFYDCDADALLIKVKQIGAACHTGNRSCFYRKIEPARGLSRGSLSMPKRPSTHLRFKGHRLRGRGGIN